MRDQAGLDFLAHMHAASASGPRMPAPGSRLLATNRKKGGSSLAEPLSWDPENSVDDASPPLFVSSPTTCWAVFTAPMGRWRAASVFCVALLLGSLATYAGEHCRVQAPEEAAAHGRCSTVWGSPIQGPWMQCHLQAAQLVPGLLAPGLRRRQTPSARLPVLARASAA